MSVLIEAMMRATEAYEFRNYLRQRGIIFAYSGYMTEPVLTGYFSTISARASHSKACSFRFHKGRHEYPYYPV